MARKFINKVAMLIAPESTYGEAPTLNNTNYKGLLVERPQLKPAVESIKRDFLRDSFTKMAPIPGRKSVDISFTTELKGCSDAENPETASQIHTMLKACGLAAGSWRWSDDTPCATVYWLELDNADDCHAVAIYDDIWLVQDSAGTPTNFKAKVISVVRSKDSDADADHNDWIIVALEDDTGIDLLDTQELQGDNAGTPDGTPLATVRVDTGNAVMHKGAAFRPTSDYDTARGQSLTVAYFLDGILHQSPGVLGSFNFTFEDGQVPKIQVSLKGLWSDPATQAVPADVDFLTHQPPSVCRQDLTLAHVAAVGLDQIFKPSFSRFGFDIANTIEPDKNLNAANCAGEFLLTDRQPTGGIDPLVDDLADFNPWTTWSEGDTRVLTLCLGVSQVGNRVAICLPQAGYESLSYQARGKQATYDLKLSPIGDSDDELVVIFG